ncbi:MAG: enoyl-CoA hydratase-related protein, partial [Legionella sp.]
MTNYKHWQLQKDSDNILWLGLDRAEAEVNTINEEVLDELNSLLHEISQDKKAIGLIIHSLKAKGFIAGADVKLFSKFETAAQASEFLQKGQAVFSRLQGLSIPSVAMINGFCMGGGCELALACTYRVASDEKDTRIGLPEVMLGIHPGWGGTVRLPQLIGGFNALSQVILTGSALAAGKAKSLGMIDDAVPLR